MIELKDRIEKLLKYTGLSIPKFALAIGAKTPQSVREILKGNTKTLSGKMQSNILSYLPDVNPAWLLAGEGEMLRQSTNEGDRHVNNVSSGIATLGNQSPVFKDVKIGKEGDCTNQEVDELRKRLAEAEITISRLEGRIEEKDNFIKLLMQNK